MKKSSKHTILLPLFYYYTIQLQRYYIYIFFGYCIHFMMKVVIWLELLFSIMVFNHHVSFFFSKHFLFILQSMFFFLFSYYFCCVVYFPFFCNKDVFPRSGFFWFSFILSFGIQNYY